MSAIYNGREDINGVANFFLFFQRERLLERRALSSLLGRSDDKFSSSKFFEARNFVRYAREEGILKKIYSLYVGKVIQIFVSYKGECNGDTRW